jgi:hypothetical protein
MPVVKLNFSTATTAQQATIHVGYTSKMLESLPTRTQATPPPKCNFPLSVPQVEYNRLGKMSDENEGAQVPKEVVARTTNSEVGTVNLKIPES